MLLKAGADVTLVEESSGCTPLHFVVNRNSSLAECLLEAAAAGGKSERRRRRRRRRRRAVAAVDARATCPLAELPLNAVDREGRSALWCALLAGKFDTAQLLIEAGAHVDDSEAAAEAPLIRAMRIKRDDIVQWLLASGGASVDVS